LEYGKASNARKAFWDGERKAFAVFFRRSLDASRTHQVLLINNSAHKRSDWVRVSSKANLPTHSRFESVSLVTASAYSTRISFVSPCRTLSFTGVELVAVKLNWHFFLIITECGELIFHIATTRVSDLSHVLKTEHCREHFFYHNIPPNSLKMKGEAVLCQVFSPEDRHNIWVQD